jgi:hypothetical protein
MNPDKPTPENALERFAALMWEGFTRFVAEEWFTSADIPQMVRRVAGGPLCLSERKLRLFACACCHRVWHLIPERAARGLVWACERYSDGLLTAAELGELERRLPARHPGRPSPRTLAREAARSVAITWELSFSSAPMSAAIGAASNAAEAVGLQKSEGEAAERQVQADLLRDIVGNPLQPVVTDPSWLSWDRGAARGLAQSIYTERAFDRLPILADALEDAGCTDAAIFDHLRTPGPHVRGCFVVDALLGKK